MQGFSLALARALTRKLGAEQVSLACDATGPGQHAAQRVARLQLVHPRAFHLSFHTHQARGACLRAPQILSSEDGDHVPGLKFQVVRGVSVHHGLAQMERQQPCGHAVGIQALHGGVLPVRLVHQIAQRAFAVGQALARCGPRSGFPVCQLQQRSSCDVLIEGVHQGRGLGACTAAGFGFCGPRRRAGADFLLQAPRLFQFLQSLGVQVLHQPVLAQVVVTRHQGIAVGDQVADAHAGRMRMTQGVGDIASQGHGVGELGCRRPQGDDIAVSQPGGRGLPQVQPLHLTGRLGSRGVQALQTGVLQVSHGSARASQTQDVACRCTPGCQLEDGRVVHGAQHRYARAGGGEHDHIAALQALVFGEVTLHDEVVQVQLGRHLAGAAQRHAAHAAVRPRATAGKHGVHQGGQAAERIGARPLGLAHHEDLDAAQLPQRDVEVEALEHLADLLAQVPLDFAGAQARHAHHAHARDADLAVAVHHGLQVYVHSTPAPHLQLVARAQGVVSGHGHPVHRSIGGRLGPGTEVGSPEQRQCLTRGRKHETLEFVRKTRLVGCRLWSALTPVLHGVVHAWHCRRVCAVGFQRGGAHDHRHGQPWGVTGCCSPRTRAPGSLGHGTQEGVGHHQSADGGLEQ